ncbi:uncharacterized protein Fot_24397 [Forsythia ovata]|uniref:Uncharacterized protein n=1 Tax=Forsythia ovata TaxID=205694 RepID=A0ABD1U630_9LAMI
MGTEVLRPQDCLVERFQVFPVGFHHWRNFSEYENLIVKTKQHNEGYKKVVAQPERSEQKKKFNGHGMYKKSWSSNDLKSRHTATVAAGGTGSIATKLVMGEVTILRREESVDSLTKMKNKVKSQKKQTPVDDLEFLCKRNSGNDSKANPLSTTRGSEHVRRISVFHVTFTSCTFTFLLQQQQETGRWISKRVRLGKLGLENLGGV